MQLQRQRRYLVRDWDRSYFLNNSGPGMLIRQASPEVRPGLGLMIRIFGDPAFRAELTEKYGGGIERPIDREEIDVDSAEKFYRTKTFIYKMKKMRYRMPHLGPGFADHTVPPWTVDVYDAPLDTFLVLEMDVATIDQPVTLPAWVDARTATEVTRTLNNHVIAQLLYYLEQIPGVADPAALLTRDVHMVGLTGSPCSGKTTQTGMVSRDYAGLVHVSPEVATIIFGILRARLPLHDRLGMALFQRNVHSMQTINNAIARLEAVAHGIPVVLCDRTELDGIVYCPGGVTEYERICRTNARYELEQYAAIIRLGPVPRPVFEENKHNNPNRKETYEEVLELAARTDAAYFHQVIPADGDLESKYAILRSVLDGLLNK